MINGKGEEIIWVDAELAKKWNALKDRGATKDQQEVLFNEYMKTVTDTARREFQCQLEGLEEDAAIFTGLMLKVKQSFEKAKNEHLAASYDLWEKFEADIPSTRKKVEAIVSELEPLRKQLAAINDLLGKINTYNIDRLGESISHLGSTYGVHREMIDFLVKNFKNKEAHP